MRALKIRAIYNILSVFWTFDVSDKDELQIDTELKG